MNRTIKNIFAITALTLTFAPALHCEETKTSKLQSVINYVKNLRKPLTPQEQLAQHIVGADIAGFKNAYNSFQKWPADERAATLQVLAITAQEVKQTLQTELESNRNKVNKTTLAKGIAQTVGGLYGLGMALYSSLYYTLTRGQINDIEASISGNVSKIPLAPIIKYPKIMFEEAILPAMGKMGVGYNWFGVFFIKDPNGGLTETQAKRYLIALVGGTIITPALIGSLLNWYGLQNCKNGWNYKAYVQQQITNIDEINEFIQAQLKLS